MQIKKDEVKEKIMSAAKQNFFKYGFEKASLRQIAADAGVTKGNIYNYFRNKDELFCELVNPAMKFIRKTMRDNRDQEYILLYINNADDSAEISRKDFAGFMYSLFDYKEEMKLLFFSAGGSSLENFREEIFELYTEHTVGFTKKLSEIIPGKEIKLSEMLIHTLASMYLRLIEEILVHEPSRQELDEYTRQMATLVHHGFMSVIKLQL